jgi:hypothetical protein
VQHIYSATYLPNPLFTITPWIPSLIFLSQTFTAPWIFLVDEITITLNLQLNTAGNLSAGKIVGSICFDIVLTKTHTRSSKAVHQPLRWGQNLAYDPNFKRVNTFWASKKADPTTARQFLMELIAFQTLLRPAYVRCPSNLFSFKLFFIYSFSFL